MAACEQTESDRRIFISSNPFLCHSATNEGLELGGEPFGIMHKDADALEDLCASSNPIDIPYIEKIREYL